jgi:ubiquinone/menaquinone biosynthesis C-methylase UbiE
MHALVHGASHSAATQGHVLGSARRYDLTTEILFLGRRRATYQTLIAAARVQAGEHVLDVGCGTGYFARLIARAVEPDGLVVGVDPSGSMIFYARRKAGALANCEFQIGAAQALPVPSAHFDVVTTSLVLHHLPEDLRVRALREMARALRPGGRLLVAEAQMPRQGWGWKLLAHAHGFERMARQVPHLEPLAAAVGFVEIQAGEAPPWLRFITAVKV